MGAEARGGHIHVQHDSSLFSRTDVFFFFFSTDETEDEALPAEVYRERKNRDYLISILCIDGYRYIVRGKSFRDAVQVWENGPDGPRLSQCPRKSDAAAVPKAPAEPDMKDAPDAQGR